MTRWLFGLSAALALSAACAGTGGAERSNMGLTGSLEIPPVPKIPEMTNLDRYPWGTPMFPKETEAAYAVILSHPTDKARFQIYLFDPQRRLAYLHGEGNTEKTLPATLEQINRDLIAIRSGAKPEINHGIAGQEIGPVPHPIGPGTDLKAWQGTYKIHMATQEMVGP